MAFTKILGPGIHTLANFHSHNINSSGIITATKFVGDMEPGGGTGSFDSLTVTGNLGVGGTVTYTDVTNVDAIGIITAQSGIHIGAGATIGSFNTTTGISSFKTLNVYDSSTFDASVGIADSIFHIGDTHTAIRFPGNDIITAEIAGTETLRIDGTGLKIVDKLLHSGDTDTMIRFPEANTFTAETNGVERLRITSSGRVGIGTTNPNAPINVRSSDNTLGILTSTTSGANLDLYDNDTQSRIRTVDGRLHLVADYDQDIDDSEIRFYVDNDHKISINSDGHLLPSSAGAVDIGSTSNEWGDVYLADDKKVFFGSDQDFSIKHSGTNAFIDNDTGNLNIQSDTVYISNKSGGSIFAEFTNGGASKLRYAGGLKFETTGIGVSVHGEVAATQDYPNIRPVLDFNFAADKKLDPRITYTRTGPASYYDEFGKVVLVGDNVPRFDHDLTTRESKGLLLEETRTNLFLYGTTPGDNWTGSKAGTFEENTTETTAPDGTFTATKWTFTTTDPYLYQTTTLGANTTYTMSMWVKAGTNMSGDVLQFRLGAAPYSTFGNSRLSEDGSWKRITYTKTVGGSNENSASVGFEPQTHPSGNPAVGDVIYIWGAQLEVGGFVTSFIPTNGSTAARGEDLCQITGEDFSDFYNQDEGTIVSEHSIATGVAAGENTYVYQVDDGSDTNVAFRLIDHNSAHGDVLRAYGFTGGNWSSPQYGSETSTPDHDSFLRVAVGVKKDDFGVNFFGGTTSTDTSGEINVDMTQLTLGNHRVGTAPLQGYLRRFIYYPQKITTNQLKTITS